LQYLKDANLVNENTVTKPNEVEQEDLLLVHTARYLKSLKVKLKYGYPQTYVLLVTELNILVSPLFSLSLIVTKKYLI
jgi:hypothetical protein